MQPWPRAKPKRENGEAANDLADIVGHKSTSVTRAVYRHVIVPVIKGGAAVITDDVFGVPCQRNRPATVR